MKLTADTPAQQRRQLITLGLLVVIGVYIWSPWAPGLTTAEVPAAASNTPVAATPGAPTAQALPEPLKLAALRSVNEATGGSRDPFGFGIPPRPPAPPPPVYVAPPPPPPPEVPRPVGPPPRPKIPVKFLGFAEDPNRPGKLVSLSISGAVVLVREGDVVDGKYRLLKVGLTSIVMAYLDGQGQQVIALTGT